MNTTNKTTKIIIALILAIVMITVQLPSNLKSTLSSIAPLASTAALASGGGIAPVIGEMPKAPVKITLTEQGDPDKYLGGSPFFATATVGDPFTYLAPHVDGYCLVGQSIGKVLSVEPDYSSEIAFVYTKTSSKVTIVCKEQGTNAIIRDAEIANPVVSDTAVAFDAPNLDADFYTPAAGQNLSYIFDGVNAVEKTVYYTKDEATVQIRAVNSATGQIIGAPTPLAGLRKGETVDVYAPAITNYILLDPPSPVKIIATEGEVVFRYDSLSESGVIVRVYAGKLSDNILLQSYVIPAQAGAAISVNPAAIQIPGYVYDGGSAENKLSVKAGEGEDIIVIMTDARITVTVKADVGGVQTTMPAEKAASGEVKTLYPPYIQGCEAVMYSIGGGAKVQIPKGFAGYRLTFSNDLELVWYYEIIDATVIPKSGSLTIIVTIASTGLLQQGAAVRLTYGGTESVETTDADGKIALSDLEFGAYGITAAYGDYSLSTASITLTAVNANQTVVLTLGSGSGGVVLPASGTLTAYVTLASTGQPQSGATVKVFNSSVDTTYTTDSYGKVSISNLSFGTYTVTASYSDYNLGITTVTLSSGNSNQTATLALSKGSDNVLQPTYGTLTAFVKIASTGQPQSGATVRVYNSGRDTTHTTDVSGTAILTNVSFGTYTITASYSGYNTASTSVTLSSGNANQIVTLSLSKDSDTNNNGGNNTNTAYSYLDAYNAALEQSQYANDLLEQGLLQNPYDTAGDNPNETAASNVALIPRFEFGITENFAPLEGFIDEHVAYIYGYPDGDLRPDADITRAEAASIIFRLLQAEDKNEPLAPQFADIDMSEWYAKPVTYLAHIEAVAGYYDGMFRPDESITRAEFITILSRFDKTEGNGAASFFDVEGHWAEEYINKAAAKGWITGYFDGSFKPDDNMTRAEMVTMVNRVLYRGVEMDDIPGWAPTFNDLPETHWAYAIVTEAAAGHDFYRKFTGYEIWTGQRGE